MVAGATSAWAEETTLLSWSVNGSSQSYTNGFSIDTNLKSASSGYRQDNSTAGTTYYIALFNRETPLSPISAKSVTLIAKLGGGSANKTLSYPMYACYVDKDGNDISGSETVITSKITTTTGDSYNISMPTSSFVSAHGVKIYHVKTSNYNVKFYSFSLSFEEPDEAFSVTFADSNSTLTESSPGNGITLPSRTNIGSYTFLGWSETEIEEGSSIAGDIKESGSKYFPVANTTLYPAYSYPSTGQKEEWVEIFAVPEDGYYAICSDDNNFMKAEILNNRFANGDKAIKVSNGKLVVAPAENCIWEIYKGTDNYYRIKYGESYAAATTTDNQGQLLQNENSNYAKWAISYNNGFVFENYGRRSVANRYLRNNASYGWAAYQSGTGEAPRLFQQRFVTIAVTLFTSTVPTSATIPIASACTDGMLYYGTYSNTQPFVVPSDLEVYEMTITNGVITRGQYETGAVVPANTGVLVASQTAGNHTVNFSSDAGTSVLGANNMLRASGNGIDADAMEMADANCKYYRLTMHNGTQIGFYWGAENGAAFSVAANKAYLAVPVGTSQGARGFNLFGEPTGIQEVMGSTDQHTSYNLQGQRVATNTKGLVIKNGKKYFNK